MSAIDSDAFLKQTFDLPGARRHERARPHGPRGGMRIRHHRSASNTCLCAERPRPDPIAGPSKNFYERADRRLAKTQKYVDDQTVLIVHRPRFRIVRARADLNCWLLKNGYLAWGPGATGKPVFKDIVGAAPRPHAFRWPVFISIKGREALAGRARSGGARFERVAAKLRLARRAWTASASVKRGPRTRFIPTYLDVPLGCDCQLRRRVSGVVGCGGRQKSLPCFQDNKKAWSGDHCIDLTCARRVSPIANIRRRSRKEDMAPAARLVRHQAHLIWKARAC